MLNANNPAVNLATRRFLRGLMDEGRGLDEASVALLDRALQKVKSISPSGWVLLLASSLGATNEDAMEAASFVEMYYAMCSFTDDVQDGDAAEYMGVDDQRLLVNTVAQLICVTVVRKDRLEARLGGDAPGFDSSRAFLDGAVMLRGQRVELLREDWSVERYREVARLSAGRQLDVYFRAAALAAGVCAEPLLRLSDPLGLLVQVMHDRASEDERLLALPDAEVARMVERAATDLREAAEEAPEEVAGVVEVMLEVVGVGVGGSGLGPSEASGKRQELER